jgi:hypothetical protein
VCKSLALKVYRFYDGGRILFDKIKNEFFHLQKTSVFAAEEFIKTCIKNNYYDSDCRSLYSDFLIENNRKIEASRIIDPPYKAKRPVRLISKNLTEITKLCPPSLIEVHNVYEEREFVVKYIAHKTILPDKVLEHDCFKDEGKIVKLDATTTCHFKNGFVTRNGAFFSEENYYPSDNRMGHGAFLRGAYYNPKLSWHRDMDDEYSTVSEYALIVQKHPMINYYHFLIEQAPNLILINELKQKGVEVRPFLQKNSFNNLFYQAASVLGVANEKDFLKSTTYLTNLENAFRPSYSDLSTHNCFLTPKLERFVNKLLSSRKIHTEVFPKRRIFISRGDAGGKRDISNELNVINLLSKYGFEVVTLTGLSLIEQIDLFNGAEVVIGGHGAGLSNIIFCPPGCKVVELTHYFTLDRLRIFWDLASYFNLEYSVICSDVLIRDHSAGFEVPIEQLQQFLNQI